MRKSTSERNVQLYKRGLAVCLVCSPVLLVFGCPAIVPVPGARCGGVTCAADETCVNNACVLQNTGGDPVAGAAFFLNNGCMGCHGADATGGDDGPNLHAVDAATIFARIAGTATHPIKVQGVTQQDAEDVQAWIDSLP